MNTCVSSLNTSIGESMIEAEQKVELILHQMKMAHNHCDLNTARNFTNHFRQRLDAVFDSFMENTNFDEKSKLYLDTVGSSSANIIIANGQGNNCNNNYDGDEDEIDANSEMDEVDVDSDSDAIWIIDSDDEDSVSVATKRNTSILSRKNQAHHQDRVSDSGRSKLRPTSPNKIATRFSLRQRTSANRSSQCCGCQSNHSSPHKINMNILKKPTKRENEMQISEENGKKTKHESRCQLFRFECYLCGKTLRDRSQCKKHLRWHAKGNKRSSKHWKTY